MKSFVESFLELIYPEKNICCVCGVYDEIIGEKYICVDCYAKIKKVTPPCCVKCSKPMDLGLNVDICKDCAGEEKHFETSKSPFEYDGLIKKCIYDFKYYNKPYFYRFFGSSLISYMNENNYNSFDFILSVPLHRSKMIKRGYNQSELLAKYIAGKSNIPYVNALKRTKKTSKQSSKSKSERQKNLKNAFKVKQSSQKIKNSSVLLVDDVYTTGSTADECSKVLLNFGVEKVFVITIAR
ncbi:MAG: phosphoribosyltransferase [Bacillota bacterium]|nr:phosphoribosyltransferase [Bacillota bacterium]